MRKQILIWSLLVFLIPALACNFIGGGDEEEAAPAPVEAEVESQTEVEEAPAQTESSTETEAVVEAEAQEEIVEEPAEAAAEVEAETAGGEEEAAAANQQIDLSNTPGLDSLSSYRISFMMDFEGQSGGQPSNGMVDLLLEASQEPPAKHLEMEIEGSTLGELGELNRLEIYEIDDTVYMYNDAMGGQWISMPGGDNETFTQGFFSPDENLEVPNTASCASGTETINGIEATLCTFDASDLQDMSEASYGQVDGRVWVAEDGGYVVKYEVSMEGFRPAEVEQQGLFDFGNVAMSYEILEVNTEVNIELPAEAANAQGLDFGALTGGDAPASADVPVLDDAEQLFTAAGVTSYVSASSLDDAVAFYKETLAGEGWTESADGALVTGSTALLTFEKDGSTLNVSITQEAGGNISVNIITS